MSNDVNPLEYHYKINIKLNYFILSADIALLGWTVVNTEWLPKEQIYIYLITTFWILIVLSIISGIIRQLYDGMAFGVNHQTLLESDLANKIERSSATPANFINQQTGEIIPSTEFKKYAERHRVAEKKGNDLYEKFSKKAGFFGNTAILLLVLSLFLFALIKISIF